MTDKNFQVRRVNNATGDIPVDEQIVCSKADKLRWENDARIDELLKAEEKVDIHEIKLGLRVSRTFMINYLEDRIAQLKENRK